eukprot:EG_transcript_8341
MSSTVHFNHHFNPVQSNTTALDVFLEGAVPSLSFQQPDDSSAWRFLQHLIQQPTNPHLIPSSGSDYHHRPLAFPAPHPRHIAPRDYIMATPTSDPATGPASRPSGSSSPSPVSNHFVHSPYASTSPSVDFLELRVAVSPSPSSHDGFLGHLTGLEFLKNAAAPPSPRVLSGRSSAGEEEVFSPMARRALRHHQLSRHHQEAGLQCDPVGPLAAAEDSRDSQEDQEDGAPQPPSACSHPRPWKRLRARRGTTTFSCLRCYARWQVHKKKPAAPSITPPPVPEPLPQA